jgi:hypothetical protein
LLELDDLRPRVALFKSRMRLSRTFLTGVGTAAAAASMTLIHGQPGVAVFG